MDTRSRNTKREASRQRLRERIVAKLSATDAGKKFAQKRLEKIADRVMKLFDDRVKAVQHEKATVWSVGERRILQGLRNPR